MKIVLLQCGPLHEVLVEMSMLIGLKKAHPQSKIFWIGEPQYFDLIKYNKRVHKCIKIHEANSLDALSQVFHADICINPSLEKPAKEVTSLISAKQRSGFESKGPVDRNAEFFQKILTGEISSNKNVLDIYYGLAGLKWKGEGYGLSYYPRTKQTIQKGEFFDDNKKLPKQLFRKLDALNQYAEIVTDDLFLTHASLALRKNVTLVSDNLPYQIHFFKKGRQVSRDQYVSEVKADY